MRQQLFDGIINLVLRDRNGETINTQLIRDMTDCFGSFDFVMLFVLGSKCTGLKVWCSCCA
jgi:hypothetical protein